MIRYRLTTSTRKTNDKRALCLTDFADVALLVKRAIEEAHPEVRVKVWDCSPNEQFFPGRDLLDTSEIVKRAEEETNGIY